MLVIDLLITYPCMVPCTALAWTIKKDLQGISVVVIGRSSKDMLVQCLFFCSLPCYEDYTLGAMVGNSKMLNVIAISPLVKNLVVSQNYHLHKLLRSFHQNYSI